MGQKVNPHGARVGVIYDWSTRWYAGKKDFANNLVEDYKLNSFAFDELASLLTVVVIIYLVLAILMALVVLLNLDSMFVDEKKRELIVLRINGFSVSSAKAYIYNDSIVLSVVGILLGILFGWLIGDLTVGALEPMNGFFFKGFNVVAAIIGVLGAGVLAAIMLIIALRRIPKLDLTDINRF